MGAVSRASDEMVKQGRPAADVSDMVDILYDLVAFGVDQDNHVALDEVQKFLHEHARTPKSEGEFHSFFAEQGIEARAVNDTPLPLHGLSAPIPALDDELTPLPSVSHVRPLEPMAETLTTSVSAVATQGGLSMRFVGLAGVLVLAILVGLSAFGVTTVRTLRSQLLSAQQGAAQERMHALEQQQRAELALRDLRARDGHVQQLEQQNRTLQQAVDALAAETRRATEEAAATPRPRRLRRRARVADSAQ